MEIQIDFYYTVQTQQYTNTALLKLEILLQLTVAYETLIIQHGKEFKD